MEQYSETIKLYLCEKHFEPSQIIQGKRRYLMKNAVPIYLCATVSEFSDEIDFSDDTKKFKILDKICEAYILPEGNAKRCKISWNELYSKSKIFVENYDNFNAKRFKEFYIISMHNCRPPFDNLYTIQVDQSKNVRFYCKSSELNRQIFKDFFPRPYIAGENIIKDLIFEVNSNIKYYLDNTDQNLDDTDQNLDNTVQNLDKDELIDKIRN